MNDNPISQKDYYQTTDLGLATTLSLFFNLLEIKKYHDSNKAYFVFKKDEKLDVFLRKYWNREIKIEPQTYFNQLRVVKSRLYSG